MDQQSFESEINQIKERNARVEADKAWETSWTRKILIAVLTYLVIALFLFITKAQRPFATAVIPTIGFVLSTVSLSFAKKVWLKYKKN